ncbi:MAG TPA: glutamyl-tRNA reductase [Candidatus Acidoferrales bacterium]|nr:glutamyl-tRNA reductase [Candidatus Acidoferrales bacterium]
MQIVIVGLSHRTAPVELRERVAFTADTARHAASALAERCAMDEAVVLSTCNRSEVYGVRREPGPDAASLERFFAEYHHVAPERLNGCLYFRHDVEAVRHLFRVAAGLDSLLLGETEILGQVREAYRLAADSGSTGPVLNRLFQAAIEAGKRVRAETELSARPISVAGAAVKLAEQVFGQLERHSAMIVGAGEVAQQVAAQMRHRSIRQLWIVSRQREHAEDLARRAGGETFGWEQLGGVLSRPDILVASVAAEQPVVTTAMLSAAMAEREHRSMFLLDLGVPRNIEPAAADLYNLYLYDIDHLTGIVEQNRLYRERETPRAEAIIAAQVAKFQAWSAGQGTADLVDELRGRLDARRRRLLQENQDAFAHLGPEERERIDRFTEKLLDELLREPTGRLRRAQSWRQRVQQIETLRALFGLDSEDD